MKVQANNRRDNHFVEWEGERYTVQGLAEELAIKPNTLLYRIRRGWTVEEAVKGTRKKRWMIPLKALTDEDFNSMLIEYFKIGAKCYPLAKKYKVDNGNLSRVLKRKDVIEYYEENLNES